MWTPEMTKKYERVAELGRRREKLEGLKTAKLQEVAQLEGEIGQVDGELAELTSGLAPSRRGGRKPGYTKARQAEIEAEKQRVLDFLESNTDAFWGIDEVAGALQMDVQVVTHRMRGLLRQKRIEKHEEGLYGALPGKNAASG